MSARAWAVRAMLLAATTVAPLALDAQRPGPTAPHRGESISISVLTFGPGDLVFERFGHNALRVRDAATGSDLSYNWGMFSFDDPNFLGRFLSGDTRYWVDTIPTAWLVESYRRQDRTIHEQALALTPTQRLDLATLVAENVKEENRYYRYDYFLDNCSTRLRDAIDRALGGTLAGRFKPMRTEWSFRSESTRLTAPDGLAQAGMDIALGPRADAPISAWDAMFIPMRLRDYLRDVTVATDSGTVPLVANERVIFTPERRAPEPAERRGLSIGGWGLILGAWMLLLAPFSAASRRRTRIPAAVMVGIWYTLTGILGLALLGMWLGSPHVFWYRNLNLLLLSPLGVVAAVPVARAVLRGAFTRFSYVLAVAIVAMAVLTLPLVPFVSQRLGGPMLLLLPAHVGLAVAIWRHTRVTPAAP